MFLTLIAAIISFMVSAFTMPYFIKFYQLKKLVGNKCMKMSSNI